MESNTNFIEPLIQKIEEFGKTSLDLIQLKSLNKSSEIISDLTFKVVLFTSFSSFFVFFCFAVSIYIGKMMGEIYCGFFIVSLFFGLVYFIIMLLKRRIKRKVKQAIISQINF
jgi:hypothetical protein